ncbi:MAG: hypothetical protein HY832_01445 [Candidatus Aenigmarchaeota archaeon]|nr:hypothetical protein [Candidatus Aenigmarchaeota archaeon]
MGALRYAWNVLLGKQLREKEIIEAQANGRFVSGIHRRQVGSYPPEGVELGVSDDGFIIKERRLACPELVIPLSGCYIGVERSQYTSSGQLVEVIYETVFVPYACSKKHKKI